VSRVPYFKVLALQKGFLFSADDWRRAANRPLLLLPRPDSLGSVVPQTSRGLRIMKPPAIPIKKRNTIRSFDKMLSVRIPLTLWERLNALEVDIPELVRQTLARAVAELERRSKR
jgi:hypothetical protein